MDELVKEGSLGSLLLRSQIISEEDLRAALDEQQKCGCRIGEALVKRGVVTQEDIDWALSNQLNIPYVRLKKENIDRAAVERVPATLARRFNLMPLFLAGDELSIAISDPLNKEAITAVACTSGCQITVSVAFIREIREMQELFYGREETPASFGFTSLQFPPRILDAINADLSGARLLNYLLLAIVRKKLTSLSLQPLGDTIMVIGRSGGIAREMGRLAAGSYPELLLRIRKLSRINGSGEPSARGMLAFLLKGKKIPYQVALLRGRGGDYVTLKLHIVTPFPAAITDVDLSEEAQRQFSELAAVPQGMVIFSLRDAEERCRSIDLYLDERATAGKTVLILGSRAGRGRKTFPRIPVQGTHQGELSSLIMASLDHDPDIIVIEDASDSQAFIAAGKAAMRGKLVVAGVSFGDLGATFKNLLVFWHRNYYIPTCVKGLISFKGVLTLCPHCKESYTPTREESAALRIPVDAHASFRAKGCPVCDYTGYAGRRYLMGLIPFDRAMLDAFETARDSTEIIGYLSGKGYRGIREQGLELLEAGEISPEEFAASIIY